MRGAKGRMVEASRKGDVRPYATTGATDGSSGSLPPRTQPMG